MKCYNAFGIKPTNSFTSAGSDYYIPNLDTAIKKQRAYKAFEKSYSKTTEEINEIISAFNEIITQEHKYEKLGNHIANMVHLYLALDNPSNSYYLDTLTTTLEKVIWFFRAYITYDEKNDKVGIVVHQNDSLFINSGIKIALDTVLSDKVAPRPSDAVNLLRMLGIGVAGLYVNKSGMGNKGWDVRACLVDEDYSGFVHLSMAFTKPTIDGKYISKRTIYCGDKLTQMVLIPVFHDEYIDADEETYNKIMENSQRGDKGFGSQDIKH
jgi:dUTPase